MSVEFFKERWAVAAMIEPIETTTYSRVEGSASLKFFKVYLVLRSVIVD
jgi:hypothetical protein